MEPDPEVAPSNFSKCYCCGVHIPKGSWRLIYREERTSLSFNRFIHPFCSKLLPLEQAAGNLRKLQDWRLAPGVDDVVFNMLDDCETAIRTRQQQGAGAASSSAAAASSGT